MLFSLTNLVAAAAALLIAFEASLPRPWWALLTVYVTAQPMSGAFRPKMLYRFAGIAGGAVVAITLVPNLQSLPVLLVSCLAIWIGFCIYLAVLDRSPRAFLFQMAAFSSAVISFPYVDDPGDIFATTISRVEEMSVAILCVSAAHIVLGPWSVRPVIRDRAAAFLAHASRWTAEALGAQHTALEYEHRRQLAADVVELGLMATSLPFDQRYALATRETVLALQHELAAILPIASAAANRLDNLRALGAVDADIAQLVVELIAWLDSPADSSGALDAAFAARCRAIADERTPSEEWPSLLAASLCDRLAAFVEALRAAHGLVRRFDDSDAVVSRRDDVARTTPSFVLAHDHVLATLAGAATATAIGVYCAVWIFLAWPTGSATAAFAAIITCSFAAQDDPAPVIRRYLVATLSAFPLAALYLFVILPRVDGAGMLILVLAPALVWMGYIQADPARSARALPMFSCFVVAIGLADRFQADFAQFLNTGLAQVFGIVCTLAVTQLFRSANVRWSARRIIRGNWRDLQSLADSRRPLATEVWTARALDRLGQIAARMALTSRGDSFHAADSLAELRIGRNLIQIRQGVRHAREEARAAVGSLLEEVGALFRARLRARIPVPAKTPLLSAIDRAITVANNRDSGVDPRALLSMVGMRCNLFPAVLPYRANRQ